MKKTLVALLLGMIAWINGLAAEEVFITEAGAFSVDDGKTSVEVVTPDPKHLKYRLVFIREIEVAHVGRVMQRRSIDVSDPIAVTPGEWAFCVSGPDDVWFCNSETIMHYQNSGENIQSQCRLSSDAYVSGLAPQSVKKWITKTRSKHVEATSGTRPGI